MKKLWKARPKNSDEIITQLLSGRGIADAEKFLDPRYEDSHDPFLFADISLLPLLLKQTE